MTGVEVLRLAEEHYDSKQIKKLKESISFAETKHAGQKRLSGDDYISHPLEVAKILIEWRLDMDSVVAGVLHDTLEDTGTTLEEIEAQFGKEVAFLVDGVTKVSKARSGMRNIKSYLPKTSDNLSKLLIAVSSDLRIILIKLADRLHNLRTLEYLPKDKQKKIARESLDVFAPLADRLGIGRTRVEIENIAFSYLQPKKYDELSRLLKKRVGSSHKDFEKIRRDISKALKAEGIEYELDGRIKSVYSLYKKLQKDPDIDDIYDLLALRIVVKSKEECYRTLGIIHGIYQPVLARIKDYISVPKPNGYQSLHTTVLTPYEQIVEFQIRSERMHAFAERGLAAGFHYNEQKLSKAYSKKGAVSTLPRNLKWVTELQERVAQYLDAKDEHADLSIDIFKDKIFVFSPRGDIYDLPEGATVLDFAYSVHSEIGAHAQGAKINNKMSKLSTPLVNGDIVEVMTAKNVHPTEGWLDHVKTERARQRVRSYLKRNA